MLVVVPVDQVMVSLLADVVVPLASVLVVVVLVLFTGSGWDWDWSPPQQPPSFPLSGGGYCVVVVDVVTVVCPTVDRASDASAKPAQASVNANERLQPDLIGPPPSQSTCSSNGDAIATKFSLY
ncbi:MAG: hypothetical protein NTX64_09400 [Elusimicrobia bacterium]|nr:hypothetical protein [Elusimicrobiota bacterium]